MSRVHLSRLPGERALVSEDGTAHEVALADLPAFVAEREEDGPRWVWDDTARWCPPLLAAGVRVARCHDLRLSRRLLARAPAVDPALLAGADAELWERLGPATVTEPVLFSGNDGPTTCEPTSRTSDSWRRSTPHPTRHGSGSSSRRSRREPSQPPR
jgi:DNA polymerase-1